MMALSELGCHIDLLSFNTAKHFIEKRNIEKPDFIRNFEAIDLDNSIKVLPFLLSLFTKELYNVSRFRSILFEEKLKEYLVNFNYDWVIFEGVYMHNFLSIVKKYSNAKTLLRAQNVEYKIWEDFKNNSSFINKWIFNSIFKKFYTFERKAFKQYDLIATVSIADEKIIEEIVSEHKIQNITGIYSKNILKEYTHPIQKFFHLGAMDWRPNLNGVKWWLENVYPLAKEKFPTLEFYFAGLNMPEELLIYNHPPQLHIEGFVDFAITYMMHKDVMIVPIQEGSGFRVKILEAFDIGMVVIATQKAIQGIDAIPGTHYIPAESPDDFINAIFLLTEEKLDIQQLSRNAKMLFDQKYQLQTNMKQLLLKMKSIQS